MQASRKQICALSFNAVIVILGIVGLVLSIMESGWENFIFYTRDSNYLAMAASIFYCVYAIREIVGKGAIPQWVRSLRYIAVSCIMVTFFVVILVIMPMMPENPFIMLYGGSMLFQHTLCPILAIVSLFAFETTEKLSKSDVLKALIPTLIYAVIAIILNICRVIEGPYVFLMVYAQPWYMSVIWCIIILGIAGLLAFAVYLLYNLIIKKREKIAKEITRGNL